MRNVILSKLGWTYLFATVITTLLAVFFIRLSLDQSATDTLKQFTQSNRTEIASEETMQLASKLNALLASDNIQCVQGSLNNNDFIRFSRGPCDNSLLVVEKIYRSQTAHNLEFKISYRLSNNLIFSICTFILAEILMFIFLFRLNREKIEIIEKAKEMIVEISRQVAHDIRSPLSALNMAVISEKSLPTENINLIKKSVDRINDIANDLLKRKFETDGLSKKEGNYISNSNKVESTFPLAQALNSVLQEKKYQFKNHENIRFMADFDFHSATLAQGRQSEFCRIISNLINNSIEARTELGLRLTVSMREYGNRILIQIRDNGAGMPEEILKKLGTKGFSYGKTDGSGIGIYHAKSLIEKWNGQLQFQSKVGVGSIAEIVLPKVF